MTAIKEEATGISWIKLTCDDHMNSICPRIKVPMELAVHCQLLFLNVFVSCHVDNTKNVKLSQL
jgi:hypothetical protein